MSEESRTIQLQLERAEVFFAKDSAVIHQQFERFKRRHRVIILVRRASLTAAAVLAAAVIVQFIRIRINTTADQPVLSSYYRSLLPEGSLAQVQNQSADIPTLTLSNGSTILLNAASHQQLASEGAFTIVKEDDAVLAYLKAYEPPASTADVTKQSAYNILSTPSNIQSSIQILLPDGTLAYIGPGSTMKYPVTTLNNKSGTLNASHAARVIALRGEAYFDVAPDAQSPFIVETKNLEVSALGTAFQVKDYGRDGSGDKEPSSVATLSGRVKVSTGKDSTTMIDNQEVIVRTAGMQLYQKAINPIKMPLKLDYFEFTNRNLASIMREISNWYGLNEPVFRAGVDTITPGRYGSGPMPKRLSLRKLLDLLQTDDLHFTIDPDQKRIIVTK